MGWWRHGWLGKTYEFWSPNSHTHSSTYTPPQLLGLCLFACRSANYILSAACQNSSISNLITFKRDTLMAFILSPAHPTSIHLYLQTRQRREHKRLSGYGQKNAAAHQYAQCRGRNLRRDIHSCTLRRIMHGSCASPRSLQTHSFQMKLIIWLG